MVFSKFCYVVLMVPALSYEQNWRNFGCFFEDFERLTPSKQFKVYRFWVFFIDFERLIPSNSIDFSCFLSRSKSAKPTLTKSSTRYWRHIPNHPKSPIYDFTSYKHLNHPYHPISSDHSPNHPYHPKTISSDHSCFAISPISPHITQITLLWSWNVKTH